jgi:hypothetical protein
MQLVRSGERATCVQPASNRRKAQLSTVTVKPGKSPALARRRVVIVPLDRRPYRHSNHAPTVVRTRMLPQGPGVAVHVRRTPTPLPKVGLRATVSATSARLDRMVARARNVAQAATRRRVGRTRALLVVLARSPPQQARQQNLCARNAPRASIPRRPLRAQTVRHTRTRLKAVGLLRTASATQATLAPTGGHAQVV